jgi:hypothetical protein
MTIDEAKAHTDQAALLRMPVIIAPSTTATPTKDTPKSIAETHGDCIVDKSEVKDKGTTSEVSNLEDIKEGHGIIALNGSAIANILDERATYEKDSPEHISTLRETLFIVPEIPSISGIKDVLPEQIVFILFFHTLFFVGKVFGGLTETLDSSFKERYDAVAPALQQEADKAEDVRKIYNFPLRILKGYFEELKKKYMGKGTKGTGSAGASGGGDDDTDELTFEKFRGILVSGDPRAVLRFFGKGKNNNSFSISSKATGEGFVPNDDDEEDEEDEDGDDDGGDGDGGDIDGDGDGDGGDGDGGNGGNGDGDGDRDTITKSTKKRLFEAARKKSLVNGASIKSKETRMKLEKALRTKLAEEAKMKETGDEKSVPKPILKGRWPDILRSKTGTPVDRRNKTRKNLKVGNYVQFPFVERGIITKGDGLITHEQAGAPSTNEVMIRRFKKGEPKLWEQAAAVKVKTADVEKKDVETDWVPPKKAVIRKRVAVRTISGRSPKDKTNIAVAKINGKRKRRLRARKNTNGNILAVGDYVEFFTKKDHKGNDWSGTAPKLRGIVVQEVFVTDKVEIQELEDGSLDKYKVGHLYYVSAAQVEKIDPPRMTIPK